MARTSTPARLAAVPRDKYGRPLQVARSAGTPYTGDANAGNIGVGAEIYLGALGWVDISPDVYYRDGSTMVTISRGRPNESAGSVPPPQTCSFQLNNRQDQYSPRNPTGPYYRLIGRNTPIRIWRMQNGIRRYRYAGEMPSWPTTADISGRDVFTSVQAAGILRRLVQGIPPTRSAMHQSLVNPQRDGTGNIVAYWPLEDGSNATQYASALSGGTPMTVATAGASPASNSTWLASLPLPVMNGGVLLGFVPAYTASNETNLRWNMIIPSGGLGATRNIITVYGTGTVRKWVLQVDTSGNVLLTAYDLSNTAVLSTGAINFGGLNGKNISGGIQLTQSGSSIVWNISMIDVGSYNYVTGLTELNFGNTLASQTVGAITQVVIGDSAGLGSTVIGHVAVANLLAAYGGTGDALGASIGEPVFSADATRLNGGVPLLGRFLRLCTQQNVFGVEQYGTVYSGDAVTMGTQEPNTFVTWLQECADSGLNLLSEARDQVALVLRSRLSLYNQAAVLTLDQAQNQLAAQLQPHDDDLYTRNRVTVERVGGSSATQTQSSGALSTQDPPSGVGEYATSVSLSLGDDTQPTDQAGWRLHLGTVSDPRYPQVTINLRHPTFQNSLDRMNAALTIDIGDVIEIDNPPGWIGADPVRLIVLGYSETMGAFEHEITFNTMPESPWRVAVLDDPVLSRADLDGSTLTAALSAPLNANSFSDSDSLSPWTTTSCTLASVGTSGSSNPLPAGGPTGYGVLLTPAGGIASVFGLSEFITVGSGPYNVSVLACSPGGFGSVFLNFDWYDASMGFISGTSHTVSLTAGVWTAIVNAGATAPAGAAFLQIHVGENGTPAATDVLYLAQCRVWSGTASVATDPAGPLWTTSAAEFPFDIGVTGERMTVTGITGSSSPQTFTLARSVNGVAKPQPAGASVQLWQPMILSL